MGIDKPAAQSEYTGDNSNQADNHFQLIDSKVKSNVTAYLQPHKEQETHPGLSLFDMFASAIWVAGISRPLYFTPTVSCPTHCTIGLRGSPVTLCQSLQSHVSLDSDVPIMQSLWSRAAPSQSTCRCVSCLSTTASGVTSRSGAAASKRRLRIGNSVTALYTSIFAAAALADARAKAQRRHDWEEKIAAVKAEVNELVDEEQRILETLYSRRKSTRGISRMLQTRGLGTVSNVSPIPQRMTPNRQARSLHIGRRMLSAANAQLSENWTVEGVNEHDALEIEDGELLAAMNDTIPQWVLKDGLRMKAIQKLALRQFAIRLLLRPIIAHRYSGIPMNYAADFDVPQINVEKLLEELNTIRRRINDLKSNRKATFRDVVHDYTEMHHDHIQKTRESLDAELNQDIQLFMSKRMSMEELLMRISHNLLNSVDPERTAAFRYILIAFTRARQNDLNDLLLRTLLPNRFYLSTSLVVTIISFYRKSKNLKDFDLFLQMLSGEGYSTNLGSVGHYRRRNINGLEMVVPPLDSSNPVIFAELISAALRFDQPDRADAWLQAARGVGFFDNFTTLFYYIRFYSIRQDWEKGTSALKRAVTFLVSSTDHSRQMVERLLMLMVHLCDSCSRRDVSEVLISAAMNSGFDPSLPSSQMDVVPIVDRHFERWTQAAQKAPKENVDRPLWQKCYDFAQAFGHQLDELEVSKDDTRSQRLASLAARHAQEAISSTVAGDIPRHGDSKSVSTSQPANSASTEQPAAETTSNDEFTALKDEVAQLRELVFQLRKHHIEASFKEETPHDLEQDVQPSPPAKAPSPTSTSDSQDSPMKVKFERISDLIDSDKFRTLPPTPPKPRRPISRRKQRAALMSMMPPADSFTASDSPGQNVHSMREQAKGLHTRAEMDQAVPSSRQQ